VANNEPRSRSFYHWSRSAIGHASLRPKLKEDFNYAYQSKLSLRCDTV